jgi:subtilase family serine protease
MQLPKSILRGGLIVALLLWLPLSGRAASRAQIHLAADDANRVVLHGNVHPLAQAKFDRGAAPDSLVLNRILLVLKRDAATEKALDAAVEAEHNPASASYHHWLSPAAYHERYGVATQDVTAISNWLTSQGFAGIKLSAGGTILEFSGTAATVRRAFHTQIHTYVVNGQSHWANATDPEIPASLAPAIGGIVSLHNFERKSQRKDIGIFNFDKKTGTWSKASKAVQPAHATGDTVSPNLTTTTSDGSKYYAVGPGDFGTIYNVKPLWDAGTDGTGQQIAIVGRSAITATDVDQFRAAFGLPATKLKIIPDGDLPAHTSAEGESLLDIEWSGAVAKNATINYVVAASTSTTDGIDLAALYAVDNNVAPIVSVSYGMCELGLGTAGNGFYNELWRQAAAEGITVLVATGDGSATTCDQGSNYADWGLTVNGIASTPYNVAVGGTDFNDFGGPNGVKHATYWSDTNDPKTRASALSYIPELVWNDSCANNQITALLGFDSAESLCNSDTSVTDGLENVAGGGGGVSSCTLSTDGDPTTCDGGYDKPAWQNAAGVPDDAKRDIPDLSLFSADGLTSSFYLYCMSSNTPKKTCNYDDSDNLAYMGAGGTSFATPAMAGIVALINQKTNDRQGNANYVFYELARKQFGTTDAPLSSTLSACSSDLGVSVGSTCVFRDVVTGNNAVPCAAGSYNCNVTDANNSLGITSGYTAGVGFDLTTGLGSIDATNLINGWSQAATLTPTVTTVKVSPATGTYGTSSAIPLPLRPRQARARRPAPSFCFPITSR